MELRIVYWCVLYLCLFVTVDGANNTKHRKHRRAHKCRCRRVYKEINEAIDNKFKLLEQKFLAYLPEKSSDSTNMLEINTKMKQLHQEVQNTQESLRRESQALRYVKEHMRTQTGNLNSLRASFGLLENVVQNLTKVVERLGAISSPPLELNSETVSTTAATATSTTSTTKTPTQTAELPDLTTVAPSMQRDPSLPINPTPSTSFPRHCHDVYLSGELRFKGDYHILIKPENSIKPFTVLCRAKKDGGWTVFQRRADGSVNFFRNWTTYRDGFGNLGAEFWLGNKYLHQLTNQGRFQLRIDMEDYDGSKFYAIYDIFRIDDENNGFRLHVNGYHGTAGDSFTSSRDNHNGMLFSTFDRDNDRRPYDNCASHYRGGWWYSDCYDANLNGRYYKKGNHNNFFTRNGIQWNSIHSYSSLKFVEMMVRPSDDFLSHNKLSST